MTRKSNAQQSEPQRADLNVHTNLSAIHHAKSLDHAQCSFTAWARAASISRQSALTMPLSPVYTQLLPRINMCI